MKPEIKNALGLIACLCGVALFGALICAAGFLRSSTVASDQTGAAVSQVNAALSGKMKNHHDGLLWLAAEFLKNADGAANQIKQTAGDANKIAKQQEPKVAALTDASVALVRSGSAVVANLGGTVQALNDTIGVVKDQSLPRLNGTIDAATAAVTHLQPVEDASARLLDQGTAGLTSLQAVIDHADLLVADPAWRVTLHQIQETSQHINSGAAHFDRTLGYIELDFTPTKIPFWRGVLSTAMSQAMGIPLHFLPQRVTITNPPAAPKEAK